MSFLRFVIILNQKTHQKMGRLSFKTNKKPENFRFGWVLLVVFGKSGNEPQPGFNFCGSSYDRR